MKQAHAATTSTSMMLASSSVLLLLTFFMMLAVDAQPIPQGTGFSTNIHQKLKPPGGTSKLQIAPYPSGILRVATVAKTAKFTPGNGALEASAVPKLKGTGKSGSPWLVDISANSYKVFYRANNTLVGEEDQYLEYSESNLRLKNNKNKKVLSEKDGVYYTHPFSPFFRQTFVKAEYGRETGVLKYSAHNSSTLFSFTMGWNSNKPAGGSGGAAATSKPKSSSATYSDGILETTGDALWYAYATQSTSSTMKNLKKSKNGAMPLRNGVTRIDKNSGGKPFFFILYGTRISVGVVLYNAEASAVLEVSNNPQSLEEATGSASGGPLHKLKVSWRFFDGDHDVFILPGPTPKEVLHQYAILFGAPQVLPMSLLSTFTVLDDDDPVRAKSRRKQLAFPFVSIKPPVHRRQTIDAYPSTEILKSLPLAFDDQTKNGPPSAQKKEGAGEAFLAASKSPTTGVHSGSTIPDLFTRAGRAMFVAGMKKSLQQATDDGAKAAAANLFNSESHVRSAQEEDHQQMNGEGDTIGDAAKRLAEDRRSGEGASNQKHDFTGTKNAARLVFMDLAKTNAVAEEKDVEAKMATMAANHGAVKQQQQQPSLLHTTNGPSNTKRRPSEVSQQLNYLAAMTLYNESVSKKKSVNSEKSSLSPPVVFLSWNQQPAHGAAKILGHIVERNASAQMVEELRKITAVSFGAVMKEAEKSHEIGWSLIGGMTSAFLTHAGVSGNPSVGVVAQGLPIILRYTQEADFGKETEDHMKARYGAMIRLMQHLAAQPIAILRATPLHPLNHNGRNDEGPRRLLGSFTAGENNANNKLPAEVRRTISQALSQRIGLSRYLYTCFFNALISKVPLVATPLWVEFNSVESFWSHRGTTFALGDAIITRPIVEENPMKVLIASPGSTQSWYNLHTKKRIAEGTVETMMPGNLDDNPYLIRGGAIVPFVASPHTMRSVSEVQNAAIQLMVALNLPSSVAANGALLIDEDGHGAAGAELGKENNAAFFDHRRHWYYRTMFARNKLLLRRVDAHGTIAGHQRKVAQPFRADAPFSNEETQPSATMTAASFPAPADATVAQKLNRGISEIVILGLEPAMLPKIKDVVVRKTSCPPQGAFASSNDTEEENGEKVMHIFEVDMNSGAVHLRDAIPALDGCDWEVKIRLKKRS